MIKYCNEHGDYLTTECPMCGPSILRQRIKELEEEAESQAEYIRRLQDQVSDVDQLKAQNRTITTERDELKYQISQVEDENRGLLQGVYYTQSALEDMTTERNRLREALEWIASTGNFGASSNEKSEVAKAALGKE